MPDRSIPYCNVIMRCSGYMPGPASLPDGYRLRSWRPGDEAAWAALEHGIGDFDTPADAQAYFARTYLADPAALAERCVLAEDGRGRVVGACIAWRDRRGSRTAASLHWLVVSPDCHGLGLGRALCRAAMDIFAARGELPVYLHTQPWSWPAICLYVSLGFHLQTEDTFAGYENQWRTALDTLRQVMPPERYAALAAGIE